MSVNITLILIIKIQKCNVFVIYLYVKFYTDVLVVVEVIKSETEEDIIISWDKTWNKKAKVCLYDMDDKLLAEHKYEITRYLARTINPALYGM